MGVKSTFRYRVFPGPDISDASRPSGLEAGPSIALRIHQNAPDPRSQPAILERNRSPEIDGFRISRAEGQSQNSQPNRQQNEHIRTQGYNFRERQHEV